MTKPQTPEEEASSQDNAPEGEAFEAGETDPSLRIADLEKQLADMKDRALREMADAENTRRRAQKEREDISKYAVGNFAKEILGVADNFRRALDAAPQNITDPGVKNLIAGIDATERQLQATLDRFGIKKIEPLGQLFDPHFHQVMNEVEAPEKAAGTIVQVLQSGYMIHDRLLREALVAIAKGSSQAEHVDKSA
jgi:molecular chaperone GrpE